MKIGKYDESRFLRAEDLEVGKDSIAYIREITEETVGQGDDEKVIPTLWFRNRKKGFGLSAKINRRMCVHNYGSDETDDWIGRKLVMYRTMTEFHGNPVPCIRIRPKEEVPVEPEEVAVDDFGDDEPPF